MTASPHPATSLDTTQHRKLHTQRPAALSLLCIRCGYWLKDDALRDATQQLDHWRCPDCGANARALMPFDLAASQ